MSAVGIYDWTFISRLCELTSWDLSIASSAIVVLYFQGSLSSLLKVFNSFGFYFCLVVPFSQD